MRLPFPRSRRSAGQPGIAVAVVGIDGSGKTTVAKALARSLQGPSLKAHYFENAGGRPPLNWLAQRLGKVDAVDLLGAARFQGIEHRIRRAAIRRAVAWADRPSSVRRVAVMDRYACCQYAAVRTRGQAGEAEIRRRYASFPEPDLTVYLDVDPREAQARVERRGRDHEELDYLVRADAAYRSLPEWAGFVVVDANRSAEEVLATVRGLVDELWS